MKLTRREGLLGLLVAPFVAAMKFPPEHDGTLAFHQLYDGSDVDFRIEAPADDMILFDESMDQGRIVRMGEKMGRAAGEVRDRMIVEEFEKWGV